MAFIGMLVSGLIVGVLARFIKPGADTMGWIMTIVLGIVGAVVGGFLASILGINANGGFIGLAFSVIGAILVLFVYEIVTGKRKIGNE
ncbi:transglycosylase-associated protein [Moraxella macacae 0408225]|uniref:Transglycosylase-associated protein n=1 Tax=Moraxella macacae 0408225 TaxID=1230338 RepID=L2F8Y8_9GAMM|nr:GlsB/YeaQ/YmgE family stress response membrane protein [Moraxella macacae]ELA09221.1 transglycosylase-associated protein [Moraxella macacae 0408225]